MPNSSIPSIASNAPIISQARRVKVKVEAHTATTASGAVARSGIRMHQRPRKSSAKPASGPECSVPATGWPGAK